VGAGDVALVAERGVQRELLGERLVGGVEVTERRCARPEEVEHPRPATVRERPVERAPGDRRRLLQVARPPGDLAAGPVGGDVVPGGRAVLGPQLLGRRDELLGGRHLAGAQVEVGERGEQGDPGRGGLVEALDVAGELADPLAEGLRRVVAEPDGAGELLGELLALAGDERDEGAQVVELDRDLADPPPVRRVPGPDAVEVPRGQGDGDVRGLVVLAEQVTPVAAHGLEEAVAGAVRGQVRDDERAVDEGPHVQRRVGDRLLPTGDRDGRGVHGEAAPEGGEASERRLLLGVQEVVAPGEQAGDGAVAVGDERVGAA
jgi:hypothetical protein